MGIRSVICGIMTALTVMSVFTPLGAYAAEDDRSSFYLPVSLSDKNDNIPKDVSFTVRISAAEGSPLPEETEITAAAQGDYSFGPIFFDEPGNYEYTVNEIAYDDDDLVYDSTVYTVEVVVIYDDDDNLASCYVTYRDGSAEKVDRISFVNEYIAEKPPDESSQTGISQSSPSKESGSSLPDGSNSPNTGTMATFGMTILIISMLIIQVFGKRRKHSEKGEV